MKTGKIITLTAVITVVVIFIISAIFFAGYTTFTKITEKNKPLTDEEKIEKTVRAFFNAANRHDRKGLDKYYLIEEKPWHRPSGDRSFFDTIWYENSGEWKIIGMRIEFSPDERKAEVWVGGKRIDQGGRSWNLDSKPLHVKKYKGEWYIIKLPFF